MSEPPAPVKVPVSNRVFVYGLMVVLFVMSALTFRAGQPIAGFVLGAIGVYMAVFLVVFERRMRRMRRQ